MFRHFLVICLVLVATALAYYPEDRVVYVDPKTYSAEMMSSQRPFQLPYIYTSMRFNGRYQINSFIVSSHVRNYTSGLEGVYEADIRLFVSTKGDHDEGEGHFKGLVPSTTLQNVRMLNRKRYPFVVMPDRDYFIHVTYGADLTYPIFSDYDLSIGPIASMQTLLVMGVDYERYPY